MKRFSSAALVLASFSFFNGCAYDRIEHFAYDALHTRQCIKDSGDPNCDPDRPTFEEYEKQRDAIINGE